MDAFKYIKNKRKQNDFTVEFFCFVLREDYSGRLGGLGQLSPTVGLSLQVVGLKPLAGFHPGWGTHLEVNK